MPLIFGRFMKNEIGFHVPMHQIIPERVFTLKSDFIQFYLLSLKNY